MKQWTFVVLACLVTFSSCKKDDDSSSGNPSGNNTGTIVTPGKPLPIPACRVTAIKMQGKIFGAITYNSNKRPARSETYDENGTIIQYQEFDYSSTQYLSKERLYIQQSSSGPVTLYYTYHFTYDNNNRLLLIKSENANGVFEAYYDSISYNGKGTVSVIYEVNSSSANAYPKDSFVMQGENVMSKWTYTGIGYRLAETYQYDTKNNPGYYLPNSSGTPEPKNNVILKSSYDSNGNISNQTASSYTYNSNGFPITINTGSLQATVEYICQ